MDEVAKYNVERWQALVRRTLRGRHPLSFVMALVSASLMAFGQGSSAAMKAEPASDGLQRAGFVPADGARIDAATGLPTRILHQASGVSLVLIPAGEFLMGAGVGEPVESGEERLHRRLIRRPFYLGETEVTVEQFRKFVRASKYQTDAERGVEEGGHGRGTFAATPDGERRWTAEANWRNPFPNLKEYRMSEKHPVVHVSWNDARRFVEHYGLQLPTEAQWEYAARAGSRTRFFWGDAARGGEGYGNVQDASGRKRFPRWNSSFPFDDGVMLLSVAGQYRPNAWSIRDIVGNVTEWCQDAYQKDYPGGGSDEAAASGDERSARVMRGGSWLDGPDFNRSATRLAFPPQARRDFVGFRVALPAVAFK